MVVFVAAIVHKPDQLMTPTTNTDTTTNINQSSARSLTGTATDVRERNDGQHRVVPAGAGVFQEGSST